MPVLARTLEKAGLATVLVTPMPYWAERVGTPRTLAVEFPFGHALGQPGDSAQQMRVIEQALRVLETAHGPGRTVHLIEKWPEPVKDAIRGWQPEIPSPVIEMLTPRFREMLRQHKNRSN